MGDGGAEASSQQETEGKLEFLSCLTFWFLVGTRCAFAPLKVRPSKAAVATTCCGCPSGGACPLRALRSVYFCLGQLAVSVILSDV